MTIKSASSLLIVLDSFTYLVSCVENAADLTPKNFGVAPPVIKWHSLQKRKGMQSTRCAWRIATALGPDLQENPKIFWTLSKKNCHNMIRR